MHRDLRVIVVLQTYASQVAVSPFQWVKIWLVIFLGEHSIPVAQAQHSFSIVCGILYYAMIVLDLARLS